MSITERPAPPVGDRLDQAVGGFSAALDLMGAGIAEAVEAVGHNRPLTSAQQALVLGAAVRLTATMLDYQLAALGIPVEVPSIEFDTRLASTVRKGDRIQACHGDDGWQLVTHIVDAQSERGLGDESRLRWWAPMDPIRVATATQEVAV